MKSKWEEKEVGQVKKMEKKEKQRKKALGLL